MGLKKTYFASCLLLVLVIFAAPSPALAIITNIPVQLDVPDTTLQIMGSAASGALVSISDGNSEVASVTATGNGQFSTTLSAQNPGLHQISMRFTDDRGGRSQVVRRDVSLQPQTNSQLVVYLPPTLASSSPNILSSGSLLKLSGYTVSYGVITFYLDGKLTAFSARAGSNGYYEKLVDTTAISLGSHKIASRSSASGTSSPLSSPVNFTLLPIGKSPNIPDIVVLPVALIPPQITSPKNGFISKQEYLDISGTAVPGSQITIYADGVIVGSVLASLSGQWTFRYYTHEPKAVVFSADACLGGNCSLPSNNVTVRFLLNNVCNLDLSLKNYKYAAITTRQNITLQLLYSKKDVTIRVYWGDGTSLTAEHYPRADSTNFYKSYDNPGTYQGYITATGSNCSQSTSFTVDVDEPPEAVTTAKDIKWLALAAAGAACMLLAVQANRLYRIKNHR